MMTLCTIQFAPPQPNLTQLNPWIDPTHFRVRLSGKPPEYFTKAPRPTQPPTLSGTRNEYQPKCGDSKRLGSKGTYGSFHLWINVGDR